MQQRLINVAMKLWLRFRIRKYHISGWIEISSDWNWFFRNTSAIFNEQDDGFAFYKISFQWYSVIGAVLTWIPTIIVSYFTGGPDMTKFNIKLFAPFVQKMFLAKYRLDELKTVVEEDIHPDKLMDEKASKQERTVLMTGNDDHQNEKC